MGTSCLFQKEIYHLVMKSLRNGMTKSYLQSSLAHEEQGMRIG